MRRNRNNTTPATKTSAIELLSKLVDVTTKGKGSLEGGDLVAARAIVAAAKKREAKKIAKTTSIVRYSIEGRRHFYSGASKSPKINRHEFVGETSRTYRKADGSFVEKTRETFFPTYAEAYKALKLHVEHEVRDAKTNLADAKKRVATAEKNSKLFSKIAEKEVLK